MKKVIIYFTSDETKNFQVITPTEYFKGDWLGLVQNVTESNDDIKNFHHFEII